MTTDVRPLLDAARSRRLAVAAGAALCVAALVGIAGIDPSAGSTIWCPYRALTGAPCPGCGMTRAVHYLLRADVATAFAYNPLLFVAVPAGGTFAVLPRMIGEAAGTRWRTYLGWAMLAVTLAFWLWRNTPWYPLLRL